jgi:threonine dehydratase
MENGFFVSSRNPAAPAIAALISGAYAPKAGQTIGVLLCGANTTAVEFK